MSRASPFKALPSQWFFLFLTTKVLFTVVYIYMPTVCQGGYGRGAVRRIIFEGVQTLLPRQRFFAILYRARICKRRWSPGIDSASLCTLNPAVRQIGLSHRSARLGIDSRAP
jgi:hypothetical protein